ncbi:MAG: hypothetical protein JNJ50_23935 [Acidobacteria bacterium]|nr:hypothetical protein [Acidobacteriota bacterium]
MSFRKQAVLLAFGVLISTSIEALGQDVCNDLAKTIVFNTSRSFSLIEQQQINKASLCFEQYKQDSSSQSLQIEAAYKFFSGGLSGSKEQILAEQNKQCEAKFGDYWSRSILSNDARTASLEALEVIKECVRLNSKGLTPRMTVTPDGREFTLTLEWNSSPATTLRVDHVGPRSFTGFKCNVQSPDGFKPVLAYKDVRTTITSGGSFTLSCERPAIIRKLDGEDLTCYRDALLSVATSGPTGTIKLSQVCIPSMPGKRAELIEKRLKGTESMLDNLRNNLSNIDSEVRNIPRFGGWYQKADDPNATKLHRPNKFKVGDQPPEPYSCPPGYTEYEARVRTAEPDVIGGTRGIGSVVVICFKSLKQ